MVKCLCGKTAIGYLHDKDDNTYLPVCEDELKLAKKRIEKYGVKNVTFEKIPNSSKGKFGISIV